MSSPETLQPTTASKLQKVMQDNNETAKKVTVKNTPQNVKLASFITNPNKPTHNHFGNNKTPKSMVSSPEPIQRRKFAPESHTTPLSPEGTSLMIVEKGETTLKPASK